MEVRLKPEVSACDWMKRFDKTVAKTPGIGSAGRASIVSAAQAIERVARLGLPLIGVGLFQSLIAR
jgi:hypothetical protein